MNNCICELFQDPTIWLIIIALILLFGFCGNSYNNNGCGCGCNGNNGGCNNNNNGCGCGCGCL